jgi:hypothetical protein
MRSPPGPAVARCCALAAHDPPEGACPLYHSSKLEDVDFGSLFERSRAELLGRADEEEVPHRYSDNLFDYWPNVKHPVGYHPSTACCADDSRTRSFDV